VAVDIIVYREGGGYVIAVPVGTLQGLCLRLPHRVQHQGKLWPVHCDTQYTKQLTVFHVKSTGAVHHTTHSQIPLVILSQLIHAQLRYP